MIRVLVVATLAALAAAGSYERRYSPCSSGEIRRIDGECVEPIINKRYFLYQSPEHERPDSSVRVFRNPRKDYNYVFVRTPEIRVRQTYVVGPPEQQSLVYLLARDNQEIQREVVRLPENDKKPEVYYINYNDPKDNLELPGGIDLQTALSQDTKDGELIHSENAGLYSTSGASLFARIDDGASAGGDGASLSLPDKTTTGVGGFVAEELSNFRTSEGEGSFSEAEGGVTQLDTVAEESVSGDETGAIFVEEAIDGGAALDAGEAAGGSETAVEEVAGDIGEIPDLSLSSGAGKSVDSLFGGGGFEGVEAEGGFEESVGQIETEAGEEQVAIEFAEQGEAAAEGGIEAEGVFEAEAGGEAEAAVEVEAAVEAGGEAEAAFELESNRGTGSGFEFESAIELGGQTDGALEFEAGGEAGAEGEAEAGLAFEATAEGGNEIGEGFSSVFNAAGGSQFGNRDGVILVIDDGSGFTSGQTTFVNTGAQGVNTGQFSGLGDLSSLGFSVTDLQRILSGGVATVTSSGGEGTVTGLDALAGLATGGEELAAENSIDAGTTGSVTFSLGSGGAGFVDGEQTLTIADNIEAAGIEITQFDQSQKVEQNLEDITINIGGGAAKELKSAADVEISAPSFGKSLFTAVSESESSKSSGSSADFQTVGGSQSSGSTGSQVEVAVVPESSFFRGGDSLTVGTGALVVETRARDVATTNSRRSQSRPLSVTQIVSGKGFGPVPALGADVNVQFIKERVTKV